MISQKENALRIINSNNPEYIMSGMPCYGFSYKGCNHEGYDGGGHDCAVGTEWYDIWGTGWIKEHEGVMGFPKKYPLADIKNYKNYIFPDPNDERICGQIYELKNKYNGGDCFLAGSHRDTLWEKAYMIAGMENMMTFFYDEPEYAREILHKIMDFQLGIAKHYLNLGVEMVSMSDDLGTQHSLLIGKDLLYAFLVPEYKRLFELYKKHGVIVNFHSCGHIEPILDMFIELGVDILNPVQATANNLINVRKITENKITLQGGISTDVIMKGPVSKIELDVKETIRLLGKNGRYFCAPDQGMPFPKENINAFYEAVEKHGKYPLT